jgi:hypothetical protein
VQNGVKIEGKKENRSVFFQKPLGFPSPLSTGFWRDLCGQTVKERAGSSIFNADQILLSPPLKIRSLSQSCLPVCGFYLASAGVPALPLL